MTAMPDTWHETFLFSVQPKAGAVVQCAGITEDITGLEWGDKDFDQVALANGGRLAKWTPQGEESASFKIWPLPGLDCGTTGEGLAQFFNPGTAWDSTEPFTASNSRNRNLHQFCILWSTATNGTVANGLTATGEYAYRIVVKNAYLTSYKPSFDDKNLSAEVTFKWTPFDRYGAANKYEESTTGTTGLSATTSFT
jgi:hypothetical protein